MLTMTKDEQIKQEEWQKVLDILSDKIPESSFMPWISTLKAKDKLSDNKENITLSSNQAFGIQIIKQKYLKNIEDAIFEVSGTRPNIEIIFEQDNAKKSKKPQEAPSKEIALMKEQIENLKQMHSFCGLNLKYTFDNFVVGENAKLAYNVAQAVSEAPGQKYNPLFIYGSIGIGKTHLMQAIGHSVLKNFPDMKIKYTKAEEFMNQLIDSIRSSDTASKMHKFRDMYRNVDVLLIDDIQFVEGKKATEDEIFNTFDSLFHAGKQIVFASDRPPSAFTHTPERLKSRYEWGLCVDILPPDFETRVAIVEKYAQRNNFEISREVSSFLAEIYDRNVRELEGAYNKISAWASINGEKLDVEKAKKILDYENYKKKVTVENVIDKCAQYFDIKNEDIKGNARSKDIARIRQIAMYLAKEMTNLSLPVVAKDFNRNHTTILYAWEKVKEQAETNKDLKKQLKEIEKFIKTKA